MSLLVFRPWIERMAHAPRLKGGLATLTAAVVGGVLGLLIGAVIAAALMRRPLPALVIALLPALLAGCDMLGIETPAVVTAKREAEGKAIGGACRHAGRAIEDCYTLNKKADKGAMFQGWREMNDYMRENKIEAVPPQLAADAKGEAKADADKADEPAPAKPAKAAKH